MIRFLDILQEANSGWWSEIIFVKRLLDDVQNKKRPILKNIGVINRIEVPVGGRNVLLYQRAGNEDGSDYIRTRNLDSVIKGADQLSKSDIIINGVGISVKSFSGSYPSIATKVNRKNFISLLNKVGVEDVNSFIQAVDSHHETCVVENKECTLKITDEPYNRLNKEDWTKLIDYLAFTGTATRKMRNPAEYVIELIGKKERPSILTKEEFVNSMLSKLILWIERKPYYSESTPEEEIEARKWSLNIRIGKN